MAANDWSDEGMLIMHQFHPGGKGLDSNLANVEKQEKHELKIQSKTEPKIELKVALEVPLKKIKLEHLN